MLRGKDLGLALEARYLAVLGLGELADGVGETPPFGGGYGPTRRAHGAMFRVAPVDVRILPALRIGLHVTYELYRLRFHTAFGVATRAPFGASRWRF